MDKRSPKILVIAAMTFPANKQGKGLPELFVNRYNFIGEYKNDLSRL
jgi:hypothetical protein